MILDCEQSLRMVTRARKSREASESKKQEAEGKLSAISLSPVLSSLDSTDEGLLEISAVLRPGDAPVIDCLQSDFSLKIRLVLDLIQRDCKPRCYFIGIETRREKTCGEIASNKNSRVRVTNNCKQ